MNETKPIPDEQAPCGTIRKEFRDEEDRQDYLDACAAADAIDEALADEEIRPFEEFEKDLGY